MSGVFERIGGIDDRIVDWLLAGAALAAVELTIWSSSGVTPSERLVTAISAVLYAAPITVRRIWPAGALVGCTLVVMVSTWFGGQLLSDDNAYVIPVLVLAYSVGKELTSPRREGAIALAMLCLFVWGVPPIIQGSSTDVGQVAWAVFYVILLLVPTFLIGRFVQRHGRQMAKIHALAAGPSEPDAVSDAAILAERLRIGGELEDVIAHSISAMVIQTGSARLLLRTDPERSRQSMLRVEETGRQTLYDLRRLLGMLRRDEDGRALRPQPGLSQLGELVDSTRALGTSCQLDVVGRPTNVTPGVDLVAYRVVEAALKAASDQHASQSEVSVRFEPREVTLEVRSAGTIYDVGGTMASLAHRVALYDGTLRTLAHEGGSGIQARLPLAMVTQ